MVDLPTMLKQSTSAVRVAGTQLRGQVEHGLLSANHSDDHTINQWISSFFSVLHAYLLCYVLLRDGPRGTGTAGTRAGHVSASRNNGHRGHTPCRTAGNDGVSVSTFCWRAC